jgi:subtilisin family serine protease
MKKLFLLLLIFNLLFSSCRKTPIIIEPSKEITLISADQIDAFIKSNFLHQKTFEWSLASDQMIWSALEQSDHILSVGYTINGFKEMEKHIQEVDINQPEWKMERENLLNNILISERELDHSLTLQKIIPWQEYYLPVVNIIAKNPKTIKMLRQQTTVRYVEPMGYEPKNYCKKSNSNQQEATLSSSGCDSNYPETGLIQNIDFTPIIPSAKQSWNYNYHNIPKAWLKSTGSGVKIFLIDTGCEYDQDNLGSAFNQGSS